jgi:hypothetical protein
MEKLPKGGNKPQLCSISTGEARHPPLSTIFSLIFHTQSSPFSYKDNYLFTPSITKAEQEQKHTKRTLPDQFAHD